VEAYTVYDVSERLRERKWIVPAYKFPENREDLRVLRVVVRNGFSRDLADLFLQDLKRMLPKLEKQAAPMAGEGAIGFHH
jgi:glutamate decarboxylase